MSKGIFTAVHIADIHFAAFNPRDQYVILKEQFLNKIVTYPHIDLISVNGDLFDHKLMGNSDGIYFASLFIDELVNICRVKQCTLILLHGTYSHDADQLKIFYHYMNDPTVDVRVVTAIQFEQVKQTRILLIPELYGVDESVYDQYLHYSGYYDEAFIHGTFEGAVYGNNAGNSKLFTRQDFDMCTGFMIGGHVHHPGCFSGYFYYCGNPYRWKFGEEEEKGFIIAVHDLDTNRHYIHFEKIISPSYITIEMNDLVSSDPQKVIEYINELKKSRGIDYLKIKFNTPVDGSNKVLISNYYRNNNTTYVEFLNIVEEQKIKAQTGNMIDGDYAYLLDDSISDIEKFVRYVNMEEGVEFITVDKLQKILEEQI